VTRPLKGSLSPERIARATRIGRERHAARGNPATPDALDIRMACAEQAVSVALNQSWDGEFKNVSEWKVWRKLGYPVSVSGLHVRMGHFATDGLHVHESDPDDGAFVLVIDRDSPVFTIVGWILGRDAKRRSMYWNTEETAGPPCFVVPQADLRSCYDLRRSPEPQRGRGEYRRDPAPDFAGNGRWPQMRYADDGSHPSKYGNIITSKWSLPCCRCQTLIPAGQPVGGNLVTGTIHGDPAMCKMKKRRASR
jgi:hypothetical protein